MQFRMTSPDWNQLRAFAATARTGSMSRAARALGLTQPTLSRQIAALEAALGATLFERIGKSLALTDTGRALHAHARAMEDAAHAFAAEAQAQSGDIGGTVTVSMIDPYAVHLMPEIAARIGREAPGIVLHIVATDSLSDLRRREADIAIRHVRPTGDGLIGRLIGEGTAGPYAAPDWIARHGLPNRPEEIAPAAYLAHDTPAAFAGMMAQIGLNIASGEMRLASTSPESVWQMARRGMGVALMIDQIGARDSGMVRLLPDQIAPRFPVWLVTHRELRTSRRIRTVFDILAEELGRWAVL